MGTLGTRALEMIASRTPIELVIHSFREDGRTVYALVDTASEFRRYETTSRTSLFSAVEVRAVDLLQAGADVDLPTDTPDDVIHRIAAQCPEIDVVGLHRRR